jgi:MFS superfamily sulfate permease-like transporter
MVEVPLTKMIWEINKIDLVPFFVTLICCLMLGIEIGILIGVCVDIIFVLYRTARPKILIDKVENDSGASYIKVTPTSAILFPSAEYVRERVMQSKDTQGVSCKVVVFDCQRINQIDFTAAKVGEISSSKMFLYLTFCISFFVAVFIGIYFGLQESRKRTSILSSQKICCQNYNKNS